MTLLRDATKLFFSSMIMMSRKVNLLLFFFILILPSIISATDPADQDFEELGLHYGKYLKEVVAALDKDQKFTETIKNMGTEDIKSGKVADQLKHVHEDVRKKLNDLKYLEIKRLRDLATRKNEIDQYGETYHGTDKRKWRTLGADISQLPEHIGSQSSYFDVNDLHKLMVAATNDLEKLDKERRQDFKTYEMEKEWQFQERLKMMNETEKQEAVKLRQKLKDKHNDHSAVNEPGKAKQFAEVWTQKDHLPEKEFDPKVFFRLHDKNSDNNWDQYEVRSLLDIEISKLYDPNNPEDDPNERDEEFERMREHIYKEIDQDRNGLISADEFLAYSRKPEFNQDHGWDDVAKKDAYTRQEYEEYMRNREQMLNGPNNHHHYDPMYYANQPSNLHLPNWAYGMPANANPAQYYGYHVDPNHPQAQQILAQHQQVAYQQQQAAYHQQAAAVGYQAAPGQAHTYQQPAIGQQYQAPQVQANQYQQPQIQHQQQQQQQAQMNYNQQPVIPQQPAPQQQQQVPQQQAPMQQVPVQQQQQPQMQQQVPMQQQAPIQQQAPMQQQNQQQQAPAQQASPR